MCRLELKTRLIQLLLSLPLSVALQAQSCSSLGARAVRPVGKTRYFKLSYERNLQIYTQLLQQHKPYRVEHLSTFRTRNFLIFMKKLSRDKH